MVLQLSFNFYLFVSFLFKNFKKQLGFIVSLRSLAHLLKVIVLTIYMIRMLLLSTLSKLIILMISKIYMANFSGVRQRFCASEHARLTSGVQSVQSCVRRSYAKNV